MKQGLTELVIILDASGSMRKLKSDVVGGFNQLIEDQKNEEGECIVTVVQFSSFGQQRTIIRRQSIKNIKPLTETTYITGGWTALFDAIGSTIDDVGVTLSDTPEVGRPENVIFAIITDGEENNSREYSQESVREKIQHQSDVYNWTFMYVGANQDAVLEGKKLGVTLAANYQDNAHGYRSAFRGISAAMRDRRKNLCVNKKKFRAAVWG